MTAQNLLYIENKNTMLAGSKGTPEYEAIMQKLKEESYKHQKEDDHDLKEKEKKKDLERIASEIRESYSRGMSA